MALFICHLSSLFLLFFFPFFLSGYSITYKPASAIEEPPKYDIETQLSLVTPNSIPLASSINSEEETHATMPSFTLPLPRTVDIVRHPEFGFGISIVGGRQDQSEDKLHRIYIKHILEASPAGQSGLLKAGDQILEVGNNLTKKCSHTHSHMRSHTCAHVHMHELACLSAYGHTCPHAYGHTGHTQVSMGMHRRTRIRAQALARAQTRW